MTAAATVPAMAAKATRREWIGLAVIALPCLVYAMDLTVLNLALPTLSGALRPSSSQLLWIVNIYGFLVAGFLITMGTLGDCIGRRKLLLIGAAAFALASLAAAFASSAEMLIALRALLGIAGATLAPSTMSLIRNMFHDEHERQFAIGVWIASFSMGGAIGPLVGGVLLQYFWWGSVFLVAVPVMLLLLLVAPRLLPEYRDPEAGRLDLVSVALSLLTVFSVVYGFKGFAEHGLSWWGGLLVLGGLGGGILFVRQQGRLAYPLLDLTHLQQPAFSAALAAYGFGLSGHVRHVPLDCTVFATGAGFVAAGRRRGHRAVGAWLRGRFTLGTAIVAALGTCNGVGGWAVDGSRGLRPAGYGGERSRAGDDRGRHGADESGPGTCVHRGQRHADQRRAA